MSEQDQKNKKKQNLRVTLSGGTLVTAEIVGAMMHGGPLGVGAGLLAAAFVYAKGQDILDLGKSLLPESVQLPEWASFSGHETGERSFMDRLFGHYPEEEEQDQPHEDRPGESTEVEREDEEDDSDSLFAMEQQEVKLPCRRITIDEIVKYVNKNNLRNQYHVWLGRSVTREKNPVVHVNIYKKHLKVIGASQKGKSSMIACLLEQICKTHDVGQVLLAILDLEDRTGKLFENDPHVVTFDMDGHMVKMHARNKPQVLEYLGYILDLMEWRYTLSVAECKAQSLLIVYIEEFQALKDHFKHRASAVKGEAKEQAKADYEALTYRISELARRGLKANIQLLLSVQVDYRDDDFVEALANITEGLCFGVKPTAAEAAGFTDARALKENYRTKIKGQAVAEFALVKDTVLAPDYDLDARLLAYEEQHVSIRSASSVKPFALGSQGDQYSDDEPIEELQPKPEEPRLTLVQKQQARKATLGDAIEIINEQGMMGRPNLQKELRARGLECSDDLARKLINDIKELAASVGAGGDAVVGD